MSRLQKSLKNAKFGLLFHVLFIAVQFFARKIFLEGLGDEFMGTVATLRSFLGFLNLAELGIGTAIGFTLYQPIFDNDHKKINQIIQFFGQLYKKVAWFILITGSLLGVFFPWIFSESTISVGVIYFAFFTFVSTSLLSYFFNYQLILLQADQKQYIVTKYFKSFNIFRILVQIGVVYFFESYIMWLAIELLAAIVYTIWMLRILKKEYPWLNFSKAKKLTRHNFSQYGYLLKKIKEISVHKFAGFINMGTDNIIIFYFINASTVVYFGNYQLIVLNVGVLLDKIFDGSKASIGNLVAEGDKEKMMQVFWELTSLRFFLGAVTFTCILFLINPFITWWLGSKYLLDYDIILLFCALFFVKQIIQPVEAFKQAFGLYGDTWAPIVEGVLNLGISIGLVSFLGLEGILWGTLISLTLIVLIWRTFYVYRDGFKLSIGTYYIPFGKLVLFFLLGCGIIHYAVELLPITQELAISDISFLEMIYYSVQVIFISILTFGLLYGLGSKYFQAVLKRLLKTINIKL